MRETIPVSEVIDQTVQGEGPNVGRRCSLVRLWGCDLSCVGCDTRYAWDRSSPPNRTEVEDVVERLAVNRPGLVVVTGGEPLIHQNGPGLRALVEGVVSRGEVEVETNGTLVPAGWLAALSRDGSGPVGFVVSPKLVGSLATNPLQDRVKPAVLRWFVEHGATFKIVCGGRRDLHAACQLLDDLGIPRHRTWIMPEGATWDHHHANARRMADHILDQGMNISPRYHLALWPDERR